MRHSKPAGILTTGRAASIPGLSLRCNGQALLGNRGLQLRLRRLAWSCHVIDAPAAPSCCAIPLVRFCQTLNLTLPSSWWSRCSYNVRASVKPISNIPSGSALTIHAALRVRRTCGAVNNSCHRRQNVLICSSSEIDGCSRIMPREISDHSTSRLANPR